MLMCNALSPEKAVIWSVLHRPPPDDLKAEYFAHRAYRLWFEAAHAIRQVSGHISVSSIEAALRPQNPDLDQYLRPLDWRALERMLKVAPSPRIADNVELMCQALADQHCGLSVHIERLIN